MLMVKYPNINAKLKGMYAKRISKTDLYDVIKQNSMKNAVILLKNKTPIFKNVDETIDRLEIESLLEEELILDINKILKLLNKNDKEKFNFFLLQYEIKCVKSMLRKLYAKESQSDIVSKNVKMWTNSLFEDIKGIETVKSFDEFFGAIKRMKYKDIFLKYRDTDEMNLFDVESEIDKKYLEALYDKFINEKNMKKLIGSEIDLLNIIWIFRMKKYYNFEKEKIKKVLINRYYRLDSKIIDKVIEKNTFEEIKEIMKDTPYKMVFENEENIELNMDKFLYNINQKIFKNDITSLSYILAYIKIVDYENNDIINAIEGIRYNMKKEDMIKRLVR